MGAGSDLTKDQLDGLLAWLDDDREIAGAKLLQICVSMEKFFTLKGAHESDAWVDETVNRVAGRLETLDRTMTETPMYVFYGFARNIFLENLPKLTVARYTPDVDDLHIASLEAVSSNSDDNYDCLDDCLSKLSEIDSRMMIHYYGYEQGKRSETRQLLANQMSISIGNLQLRVFRTKKLVKVCIEKCLSEK